MNFSTYNNKVSYKIFLQDLRNTRIPDRNEQLLSLQDEYKEWDLLVIGGGATGVGVALDAVTRGLKVALVEGEDFSSGM